MSSSWQDRRGSRPWARQVPKREARVNLESVPWAERVPPLILRLTTRGRRLRSAALLSDGTAGWATKTNSSLMNFSMRRHRLLWTAAGSSRKGRQWGQQFPLQLLLDPLALPGIGMGEGFRPSVNLVDCPSPLGQFLVLGVEGLQVVDVPQQVDPAPLLQARVMVVSGIEVTDQDPAEGIAQRLVYYFLVSTPAQKVPVGGGAEGPDVAVDPVLAPAGFVGVHHWTASDSVQDLRQRRLSLLGHLVNRPDDGAQAQGQPMHGLQVPLDGAQGQPSLFPQGGNPAEQVDSQPLFTQDHPAQVRLGSPAPFTYRTGPGNEDMLGDLGRNHGEVNDFTGPPHPAPGQAGTALGTGFQDMLHPVGGGHALAGKAAGPGLPGPFILGWTLAGLRFNARHSGRPARLGLSFQHLKPSLQLGDDGLLLGDEGPAAGR